MRKRRIIFSGGGTAGHIYPALAVAAKMKEQDPELLFVFIGSTRKLEKSIMDHHGADFIPLKIEGLKGKGLKSLWSLFLLPFAFIKSLFLLIKLRPLLSIGAGGYSSGPVVLLSSWLGIPTLILEQNALPGFTNRLLLPWVKKAVVSYESSLSYFRGKGIFIGNPVRREIENLPPKQRENRLSLLVFGGSQGSSFLNRAVTDSLALLKAHKDRLVFFHQSGQKDLSWVKKRYEEEGFKGARVGPYFFDMAVHYKKADLIICRAGATTIAELIAARKAALLFPFAGAADNHQYHNAQELEKIKAAHVITEDMFTPRILADKILHLLKNPDELTRIEKNLERIARKNVTDRISDLCFQLMKAGKRRVSLG
jgi:UDP-N-acetylglucosamine--N-acetylmuramyl-(pentapeptide) pyrophosphoryl-undecaprenol N-acetylglucosamine transferase